MQSERSPENKLGFQIVEVNDPSALPPTASDVIEPLMPTAERQSINLIGVGDALQIIIYEAGVTLFSGTPSIAGSASISANNAGTAKAETLPPIVVDETGHIFIPYAGRIRVDGITTYELQSLIASRLQGKSQAPQVLVTVANPVSQSVIIGGEIAKPGRINIATGRETLLDIIALAGGYKGDPIALSVQITRGNQIIRERLSRLSHSPVGSIGVIGGDRIQIERAPLSYSVMGAPGKVDMFSFDKEDMNLAEAIARAGGSNPSAGDPGAIFLFRYEQKDGELKPTIYHLDMTRTNGFFLAQRFEMENKDVLYIGNARANQPSKFVQILGQFFSPLIFVQAATQ